LALSDTEQNNISQILESAVENAKKMLGELLGKDTDFSIMQISETDASDISNIFTGRNLIAPFELGDGVGNVVFLIEEGKAGIIADLMIGQDGTNPPATLEDLHISAITEATSQTIDALMGIVASMTAKSILTNPQEVTVGDITSIPGIEGNVLVLEGQLKIGDFDPGKIGIVFSGDIVNLLKEGPKSEASAEGFVSDVTAGGETQAAQPEAQKVLTSELQEEKKQTVYDESLDIVLDVPLQVTVELGRTEKLVKEILELAPGSVIELDKLAGEPVDILVNQKYIAKGEVVVIDENFGIRITDIIRPEERIGKL